MPFLRLTRDQRGYENTFLLHAAQPGERPRVLYWYRSAPGVRVGRPPLDEDAIRAIEDRHPDIEFDWPHILEAGTLLPPEVERRPERQRRRPPRLREQDVPAESDETAPQPAESEVPLDHEPVVESSDTATSEPPVEPVSVMLDELVGREISTRLRARYAEIVSRIERATDHAIRESWRARAEALNPDRWFTPADILRGVQHADALFDELRREIAKTEIG